MQKKINLTFLIFCFLQILLYGNNYFEKDIKYYVYASVAYMVMMIFYDCYEIVKTEFKEKDLLDHPREMVWLVCSILWLFAFTEEDYSNLIHLNLCVGFFMIWISRIHDHIVPEEEELKVNDDMIFNNEEVRKSNV